MSYIYTWKRYNKALQQTEHWTWKSVPSYLITDWIDSSQNNWTLSYDVLYLDPTDGNHGFSKASGDISSGNYGWKANENYNNRIIFVYGSGYRSCYLGDNDLTFYDLKSVSYTNETIRGAYISDVTNNNRYQYPDDGSSGSYWYVYQGKVFVDDPPSIPSSITIPTEIREGKAYTVSWGTSTDPNGTAVDYAFERSVNGGAYEGVWLGYITSLSYVDTALELWNTVSYRVRARSHGLFSGYRTSPTVTVKHAPEVYVNIGGINKQCDGMYVNIGGVWKEVLDLYVNVGGVWKVS